MTLVIVIILGVGILLIYAAVTGKNPVEAIKEAISGG